MGVLATHPIGTDTMASITKADLQEVPASAAALNAKAMLLTDAWGTMFVLDEPTVSQTAAALGMTSEVGAGLYETVRSLSEVRRRGSTHDGARVFTYHEYPAVVLLLRGHRDLDTALSWVTDSTLGEFLEAHISLFENVMASQPSYSQALLFSPNVAARVLEVFGASVTPDGMLALAHRFDANVADDIEGRIGIAAQFIRTVSLIVATR